MSDSVDINVLHATLASTLVPSGDHFKEVEARLAQLERQAQFITSLLTLILEPNVDLGVKRASAIYLKNKVVRSWGPRQVDPISDADKVLFKQQIVKSLVVVPAALEDFLLVCISAILSYDYQHGNWPELVPEIMELLQNTQNLAAVSAGLKVLKQLCKFYRWNTVEMNKQLAPLLEQTYPLILTIAEAAMQHLTENCQEPSSDTYYGLIYEVLKIYKLSTTRYLPAIVRETDMAKRTVTLFCGVLMLPWPQSVVSVHPASERTHLLPVKCLKWATANMLRTHNTYLTKSYTHLSENSRQYAPYRELFLSTFTPEITRLYIERLQKWSTENSIDSSFEHGTESDDGPYWLNEKALYNMVTYLESMIEQKTLFTEQIQPHLQGLLGQVLYPLMGPVAEDFEMFEDDPTEFVQRRVDFNDTMLTPGYAASEFIRNIVRKRKNTLDLVVQFLQQCAEKTQAADSHPKPTPDVGDVKNKVALFNLVQALAPTFLSKGSMLYAQLEPFICLFIVPALSSPNAYIRFEACNTTTKLGSVKFESQENVKQLFQGVLNCFFDSSNMPVQVAAALTLQSLSLQDHNEEITQALGSHITEVVRNLLSIMEKIDLEALLGVLDHFVSQFPEQITPFAADLAAQLTRQFVVLCGDLAEAQRQLAGEGGSDNRVAESELMLATDEKTTAGLGMLTSLTNLQNNLEHQRELIAKLDETMSPIFITVYQNELTDFYPDCLGLHENTLFAMKSVPAYHWQFFDALLQIVGNAKVEYFDEAMPVLENYIVYGAAGLAQAPARLHAFIHLLISMYSPPSSNMSVYDFGESTAFSEAKTRIQVMAVVTKLLVSNELFNGPLIPLIPNIFDAVLSRVTYDSQNQTHLVFPPRYNVATVSIVLGGLYHDPQTTLAVLERSHAVDSFFQTWIATVSSFTRINDLKLELMAILSLFSYQTAHPEFIVPHFEELLSTLTHILDALPGAAARMAELMKQENENNLWDDDDLDDFGEDYDVEYEDEDSKDAGAEFDREVGGIGDGTFMYENPQRGAQSATLSGDSTSASAGAGDEDATGDAETDQETVAQLREALSSQMGFVTDDFDEDLYSASPLDVLNPYDALRSVIYALRSNRRDAYDRLVASLPEHGKVVLDESLQRESLPKYTL